MILLLSNAQDVTTDHFAAYLRASQVPFVRLDTEDLLDQTVCFAVDEGTYGWIDIEGDRLALGEVDAVYYRRPVAPRSPDGVAPGVARWVTNEARNTWGGLLAALPDVIWVNHPMAISRANYKAEQLSRAAAAGLAVPDTLMTNDVDAAAAFCDKHDWDVIVKPIGHGEILGDTPDDDYLVYTNLLRSGDVASLANVQHCPTLFQAHVRKEVDIRVTVVGDAVHAIALHSQEHEWSRVDCRRQNMEEMRYSAITLPDPLADALVTYVKSYDLVYGAIDLVRNREGEYWFLELNPAGQWAWLEQLGYANISASLLDVLTVRQRVSR